MPSGSRPWYVSPLADGGYDVADYRAIDPAFGTLAEAEALIAEALDARASGRSSTSSRTTSPTGTPGSRRRLPPGPGSPERDRFWFRPGRGRDGDEPPTGWPSEFQGGQTWTRTTDPDGTPGDWYLHLFTAAAARPQLGPPGRPRRARGHPRASGSTAAPPASGSTRPRCWSRTRRMPEVPDRPGAGRPPHPRPRRAARHLPGWRAIADSLSGDARPRRRGLAPGHRAVRALPPAGRAAHRLQLRLHGPAVGRRQPARIDRRDARGARPGRRTGDLGPVQPRCHPAGHPLRPRGLVVRLRPQAVRDPDRPRARSTSGTGRGPPHRGPARLPVHLPGRRAGPRRGRGPARRDPGPDARPLGRRRPGPRRLPRPAARGPATAAPFGFSPDDATARPVAHPAGALGRPDRRSARPTTPTRCSASTATALRHPARGARPRRRALRRGSPSEPDVLAFRAGDRVPSTSPTCPATRSRCRPTGRSCSPARTSRTGTFRPTRRSGCARTVHRADGASEEGARRRVAEAADAATRTTAPTPDDQQGTHRGKRHERRHAMRSTSRRPASVLTAFAVITAIVARRLRRHAPPAPPRSRAPAAPPSAAASASAGAEHEPVTIVVGALRPGVTQAAVDALYEQIDQFEAKYPWITRRARGVQLDGADVHRGPRRRHAAGRLHHPVHRRQGPDRPAPDRRHRCARPRPRLRRQVQPERARQRPGRRRQDLRRPDRGLRHVPDLQPDAVHRRPASTRQPARDVGRGPRRGQDHRREDRRRRLRLDGDREHRRLAAHDLDLRHGRPDAGSRRGRQGHRDRQQLGDQGRPRAPQGDALGRQLDGLHLRLRLGHDEPGLRGRPGRACSPVAPTCTPGWSRTPASSPTDYGITVIPLDESTRTPASSAAARSPRSTS